MKKKLGKKRVVRGTAILTPKGDIARYVVDGGEPLFDILPDDFLCARQIEHGFTEVPVEIHYRERVK